MRHQVLAVILMFMACPKAVTGQSTTGTTAKVDVVQSAEADDALARALTQVDAGARKDAIGALMAVRKKYPATTAGQSALYRAGTLAFEEGDYVSARNWLNELVFENPLHEKADDARLKSGLASVELKAWRDATQTLTPLVEKLNDADRKLAEEGLQKAAANTMQFSQALKLALAAVDDAPSEETRAQALKKLELTVESQTDFLSIAEAQASMSKSNPAWPLLTFKMARVYNHVRDWVRLDETLKLLLAEAPQSPWAADAKEMQARLSRRAVVRPRAVGVVLPMTGKYKPLGDAVLRGMQLALKNTDVELVVKDSQGDAAMAAKLVEQLAMDDGVIAIVGPLLTDDTRKAALMAEELQVPLITLSRADGVTDIGPHIFRTMVTNAQQAEALADYAMGTLGFKTFGVLYPNIPFGAELTNEFWDAVEKRGGQIRGAESYDHDQTTFTAEAKKLTGKYFLEDRSDYYSAVAEAKEGVTDDRLRRKALEKARDNLEPIVDFDALLIPDTWQKVALVAPALAVEDLVTNACDKKDIERIQKTTGKQKLKTVVLLGPSTWSSPKGASGDPQLMERGGKYVQCAVYVDGFYESSARPATKAFVDAFHEAHPGATMTLLDAVAFDTAGIVRTVLDQGKTQTRQGFREKLSALKNFEGATGTTSFDDSREARRSMFLLNITAKGVKEIAPTSAAATPKTPGEG